MTKPIENYFDVSIPLLAEMEKRLGSTFQKLTKVQTLYILCNALIAYSNDHMASLDKDEMAEEVLEAIPWMRRIRAELPTDELLGLSQFLVNRLKGEP